MTYHRPEYEDLAEIIKSLKSTAARHEAQSIDDILADLENSVIHLFETKGQSFNKTRFLNAIKVEGE